MENDFSGFATPRRDGGTPPVMKKLCFSGYFISLSALVPE